MRCDLAEREISARLDDGGDRRRDASLERHLATCTRCRAFATRSDRLRQLTRLAPVEPVPDLVPQIMARVRREAERRPAVVRTLVPRWRPPEWGRVAAAFVAGVLVAAVALGGLPGLRRGPAPALATEIPRRIAAASTEITEYRAEFRVVETNFHRRVPERTFSARVSFEAPERFRAQIADTTAYPSPRWPRNDVVLAVDGDRWFLHGPATCPREALPACATGGRDVQRVTGREPFDGDTALPTDVILPVRTLVGTERVGVVGEDRVLGRDAVVVQLAYRDAVPLFGFLNAGGSWRPFFPQDRVLVSLDAESWFPLGYQVLPAAGAERRQWALRNGLPAEATDRPVLRAEAVSFRTELPEGWTPLGPFRGPAFDQGFRRSSFDGFGAVVGSPLEPSNLEGLERYRVGTFSAGGRPEDEVLTSYTRGLAWLKVRQTRSWSEPELFGDVGDLAAPVELPGGGVGYYEPATETLGRRLSIHARGVDLYLETNLSRDALLRIAGSLPARGRTVPEAWLVRRWPGGVVREQATLDEAAVTVPDLLIPSRLPAGYRLWTVHLIGTEGRTGVAVFFRRPAAEFDGVGIRLFQEPGVALAPPMDPDVLAVRVRGVIGRYSPSRGELEWVEDGVYRSIGGAALDLGGLLSLAGSLEAP